MESPLLPVFEIPDNYPAFKLIYQDHFCMIRPCPNISFVILVELIDKLIYLQAFGCHGLSYFKRFVVKIQNSRSLEFKNLNEIISQIEYETADLENYRLMVESSFEFWSEMAELSEYLTGNKANLVDQLDVDLNKLSREFNIDFWVYSASDVVKIQNSAIPNPILICVFQIQKANSVEFSIIYHEIELEQHTSFAYPIIVESSHIIKEDPNLLRFIDVFADKIDESAYVDLINELEALRSSLPNDWNHFKILDAKLADLKHKEKYQSKKKRPHDVKQRLDPDVKIKDSVMESTSRYLIQQDDPWGLEEKYKSAQVPIVENKTGHKPDISEQYRYKHDDPWGSEEENKSAQAPIVENKTGHKPDTSEQFKNKQDDPWASQGENKSAQVPIVENKNEHKHDDPWGLEGENKSAQVPIVENKNGHKPDISERYRYKHDDPWGSEEENKSAQAPIVENKTGHKPDTSEQYKNKQDDPWASQGECLPVPVPIAASKTRPDLENKIQNQLNPAFKKFPSSSNHINQEAKNNNKGVNKLTESNNKAATPYMLPLRSGFSLEEHKLSF